MLVMSFCQNATGQENKIPKKLYSLIGSWQVENTNTFEIWKLKEKIFYGRVIKIENNDTLIVENLRIYKDSDKFIYEATVPTQNEGRPIEFVLTQADKNTLLFENPEHDFPKKIAYRFVNQNQINATISGNNKQLSIKYYRTQQ